MLCLTLLLFAAQEASCYTLQLTASPAGFDSFKPQLDPFAPASNPVYASIHRCSHGILYPDQTTIGNVTYKLDPVQPGLQSSNASLTSAHSPCSGDIAHQTWRMSNSLSM